MIETVGQDVGGEICMSVYICTFYYIISVGLGIVILPVKRNDLPTGSMVYSVMKTYHRF